MSNRPCAELGVCQARKYPHTCAFCPDHTHVSWKCPKCDQIFGFLQYADKSHDCKAKEQP
jgi:REP element-mobilizing transposase RayT